MMQKVPMTVVVTKYNLGDRVCTSYVSPETDYKSGWGLPMHANRHIISAETKDVDVFQVGDRVACEIHRGAAEDDDGISTGGCWITKHGTVASASPNGTNGFVEFDDGDRQSISLIRGDSGYPGRNIQPTDSKIEDNNPIYRLTKFSGCKFDCDPAVVEQRVVPGGLSDVVMREPRKDAVLVSFRYQGRTPRDCELMERAAQNKPACMVAFESKNRGAGFIKDGREWRLKCDGNYYPSMLLTMEELNEVLLWMDEYFSDVGTGVGGGNWRTAKGAYSTYCFEIKDFTADEYMQVLKQRRFFGL